MHNQIIEIYEALISFGVQLKALEERHGYRYTPPSARKDDDPDGDDDDIAEGDVLPSGHVADPATHHVPNVVNIFIGGAKDSTFRNVLGSSSLHKDVYGKNFYALFSQDDMRKINEQIAKIPEGTPINLIGHSWGGDTAARIALDNPGRISTLVTVDPVTTFESRPDFGKVSDSVGTWIDINATGKPQRSILDDVLHGNAAAGFLGADWGNAPATHADISVAAPLDHADFDAMMRYPLPNGSTAQQLLNK